MKRSGLKGVKGSHQSFSEFLERGILNNSISETFVYLILKENVTRVNDLKLISLDYECIKS